MCTGFIAGEPGRWRWLAASWVGEADYPGHRRTLPTRVGPSLRTAWRIAGQARRYAIFTRMPPHRFEARRRLRRLSQGAIRRATELVLGIHAAVRPDRWSGDLSAAPPVPPAGAPAYISRQRVLRLPLAADEIAGLVWPG